MLGLPATPARGIVLFAHGSGSSRLSPRNAFVAEALQRAGLATLLFDLLTDQEAANRANVFDIPLLADRLDQAATWLGYHCCRRAICLWVSSARAPARRPRSSRPPDARMCEPSSVVADALISRRGALENVTAPTLLIVGGDDPEVLALNRAAYRRLHCERRLEVVPGATHLFEEPGTLEVGGRPRPCLVPAASRAHHHGGKPRCFVTGREAGKQLADRLLTFKDKHPVVLALPRGGVPVGFEIARVLEAPLDLVLVRKIGAPYQEELAIGAIADGEHPELVTDPALIADLDVSPEYLEQAKSAALQEIERRRRAWFGDRPSVDVAGRTAIVVDDGIATGATMRVALRATRRRKPARLVLAVPVAPPDTIEELRQEVDEAICLDTPADFFAVGQFYRHFPQLRDDEVTALLDRARAFVSPART